MKFARAIFMIAGISGLVLLVPFYFKAPPMETGTEFYYGFLGIAIAFQAAFLIIASDPLTYKWMMLPCILEKLTFAVPALILHSQGRLGSPVAAAHMDLAFVALFVISFSLTSKGEKK